MRKGCLSSNVERTGVSGMSCFSWASSLSSRSSLPSSIWVEIRDLYYCVFSVALVRMDWTFQNETTACQLPGGVSLANSAVVSPCFLTEILYSRFFFTWFFLLRELHLVVLC